MADVTQIDVVDVEDHSAVLPTLLDSLAETPPHTNLRDVVDQILPSTDRGADECSSASSESCWGEMEDIGDEEEVEWGTLPRPPSGQADDRVGLREDIHDRTRARRLNLISSQSARTVHGSFPQDAQVPSEDEDDRPFLAVQHRTGLKG